MSTESKTPSPTLKARLPRGLVDRGADELAATDRMLAAIRQSYALHGFEAVETPLIEYTEALGKFLPDLDRPNEGVFSFQDDDEAWLSLRYDLTAPLARYVAANYDALPKPYRSYRVGQVFRNEKPGPGRFRQFMQFDADTVGSASVAADAEMCLMAAATLERLGIRRGDYRIKVNNRKVLDGVMESIGLSGPSNQNVQLTVLRAIDKYDRLGEAGVRALLGSGRKDESGDFTKGAGLAAEQIDRIIDFALLQRVDSMTWVGSARPASDGELHPFVYADDGSSAGNFKLNNSSIFNGLTQAFGDNARAREGLEELGKICELCEAAGFGFDAVRIDTSVVRGLEYYTGPVFEADLTFTAPGEDGRPVRFGSVGGGGRYDGLVARFRSEPVPATGFSIGVSRLFAALKAVGSPIVAGAAPVGPVVVLVLDRDELPHYQRLVTQLRGAGLAAELYLGSAGMNAQLKYADKRGSLCAVIQGSNERQAEGGAQVMIRDLVLGAELAKSTKDRADYLDLRQRAQFPVAESGMVEAVRAVLARHA